MSETHPTREYYLNKEAEAATDQERDYHALSQGPERTHERHKLVTDVLGHRIKGDRLLDIGCGTGLYIDYLQGRDILPREYRGLDILDRSHTVNTRAENAGIPTHSFGVVEPGVPDMGAAPLSYEVAVCIGITGFWGVHTYHHVQTLYHRMRTVARFGCIVFPRFYAGDKMGVPELSRFDPDDLHEFLRLTANMFWCRDFRIELMEREMILFW